jgi:hypothetical protein
MITLLAGIIFTCLIAFYQKHSWQSFKRSAPSAVQGSYKNIKTSTSKALQSANSGKIRYYGTQMASAMTQRGVIIFLAGTMFFLIIVRMFMGFEALSFISTLEHELVHGIVSVICGGSFKEMKVTAGNGGFAQVTKSNFLVKIAPYCLPLFCIASLCLIPFLQHNARIVGIIVAGLAYGSYLRGNFPNIGSQPDIKNSGGKLVAYPVILASNAALLAGMVVMLARWS